MSSSLSLGLDVKSKTVLKTLGGLSALHWSALRNRGELLHLLIKQGAQLTRTHSTSALSLAAAGGHRDLVRRLLSSGVDVTDRDIALTVRFCPEAVRDQMVAELLQVFHPSLAFVRDFRQSSYVRAGSRLEEILNREAANPPSLSKMARNSVRDILRANSNYKTIRPLGEKLKGLITQDALKLIIDI